MKGKIITIILVLMLLTTFSMVSAMRVTYSPTALVWRDAKVGETVCGDVFVKFWEVNNLKSSIFWGESGDSKWTTRFNVDSSVHDIDMIVNKTHVSGVTDRYCFRFNKAGTYKGILLVEGNDPVEGCSGVCVRNSMRIGVWILAKVS